MKKSLVALTKGVWIWGLFTWAYVVLNITLFPQAQFWDLSVYVPIPTDLVGVLSFLVSFVAFVLWEWSKG